MFYQGSSEIHPDGLQTLYLMNPNDHVLSYSPDTPHFNPGPYAIHAPPPQQFVGFPLHDSSHQDPRGGRIANHAESVIIRSKYLKAAQELLDEVVSVEKRTNAGGQEGFKDKAKIAKESISIRVDRSSGGGGEEKVGLSLTSAQRHDIQTKKSTLNSMLDEVEQRYKQYHQQMQMIVESFEQVAGTGSAKSYTQLASKTILKQFSCLKNRISTQVKALSKTLGEEEYLAGRKMEGTRLRFVDQQQRALHQLGMMQTRNNNATSWRPQRCLPERAVLLLRAWLFEHFLHPYPKDSDKQMLAKQTGLTRSQVSNWFINARVRLWKPMVEDMYLEETKSQEHINPKDMDSKSSNLRSIINNHNTVQSLENNKLTVNPVPTPLEITKSSTGNNMTNLSGKYPKKRRNGNQENSPSSILSDGMQTETGGRTTNKCVRDKITFISSNQGQTMGNYLSSSGYGSTYGISMAESDHRQQIPSADFLHGNNNFSLSLAPPPSETYSQKHTSFLSHGNFEFGTRIEPVGSDHRSIGINQATTSHPNISNFEILDFQLLHDHRFVA